MFSNLLFLKRKISLVFWFVQFYCIEHTPDSCFIICEVFSANLFHCSSNLLVFWCLFLEPFCAFWHPLLLLFSLPICFSASGWLLPCPALWTWRISQWTFRPVPCSLKAVSLLLFFLFLLSHFPFLFISPLIPDFLPFAWLVKCLTLLYSKRNCIVTKFATINQSVIQFNSEGFIGMKVSKTMLPKH